MEDVDLTEEQIEELTDVFVMCDMNSDGNITTKGLIRVMRRFGQNPTEAELQKIMTEIDRDGSGSINYEGFLKLMSRSMKRTENESAIKEAFEVFDKNKDGYITAVELQEIMGVLGEHVTLEEAKDMIRSADRNGDGKIEFSEFYDMLTGSSSLQYIIPEVTSRNNAPVTKD